MTKKELLRYLKLENNIYLLKYVRKEYIEKIIKKYLKDKKNWRKYKKELLKL